MEEYSNSLSEFAELIVFSNTSVKSPEMPINKGGKKAEVLLKHLSNTSVTPQGIGF